MEKLENPTITDKELTSSGVKIVSVLSPESDWELKRITLNSTCTFNVTGVKHFGPGFVVAIHDGYARVTIEKEAPRGKKGKIFDLKRKFTSLNQIFYSGYDSNHHLEASGVLKLSGTSKTNKKTLVDSIEW